MKKNELREYLLDNMETLLDIIGIQKIHLFVPLIYLGIFVKP